MAPLWRRFIAWSPAVLVLLCMLGRWQAPSAGWLWVIVPWIAFAISIAFLLGRMRRQQTQRREMASAFARVLASLAATETSLSVPLLLTAVALIGALGNIVESSDLLLLISVLGWLAFTTCMALLLEPLPSPVAASQEGLPPQTKGLVLFLSRKPPSPDGRQKWQWLVGMTNNLAKNNLPTWDDLTKLPEVIRARRGQGHSVPPPKEWIEALADTPFAPPFYAIAYHYARLEHLWLVVTDQTKGEELALFRQICDRLKAKFQLHELELEKPDSLPGIQQVVNDAYRRAEELGLPESEVTTDITSGSSLMSVGGVLACVRSQRRVQYLNPMTYELQEVPVGVENVAEAIQEFLEQLPQLMGKVSQRG